jgi:hypothetical protein
MPNVVEIEIRARDLTDASFAEVKGKAEALGGDAGRAGGKELSKGFGEESKAGFDSMFTDLSSMSAGQFERMMGPDSSMVSSAGRGGRKAGEELMKGIEDGSIAVGPPDFMLPDGRWASEVEADAGATGRKAGDKLGKNAGDAAGQSMSPLIIAAFGAAAAVGPALLLAATGTAMVGVVGLVLAGNATIMADYKKLATTAKDTVEQAAAPLAASMHAAVVGLETDVAAMKPALTGLFSSVGPDIAVVTQGLSGLVSNMLPGLTSALSRSQVIVADFSHALGPLGSNIGQFFDNLSKNANVTGAALESTLGVIGHTLSTLGTVINSASTAISADLMAINPAINAVLGGIDKIANPAVVGGLVGAFGAMKLDPLFASGLTKASEGLGSMATKAAESEGVLGKTEGALKGLSGAAGGAASFFAGPWGVALGVAGGALSGLIGNMLEARHQFDAVKLSTSDLAAAIRTDGDAAGQATDALIMHTDAAKGLTDAAAKAGVSIQTLVSASTGDKTAQEQVTKAVSDHAVALFKDAKARGESVIDIAKQLAANQQVAASMKTQSDQVLNAIAQQKKLDDATYALNNTTTIFNATLGAMHQKMVDTAQTQSMAAVSALNLGSNQSTLNMQLADSVDNYLQATDGANGYNSVLEATNGTMNSVLGTEAAFTTQLSNLTAAVKTNGTSLDVNTKSGAANITVITKLADAAQKVAVAQYQNEIQTKGADKAYADANATLATSRQRFIDQGVAMGLPIAQVKTLAAELFNLPPQKNINISADTSPALASLAGLLNRINTSSGTVRVYTTASGSVGSSTMAGVKAQATGGIVGAAAGGAHGSLTWVGEQGPELLDLPYGSTVTPNSNVSSLVEAGGRGWGGDGGEMKISFAGNTDSAFATAFMRLVRTGAIQIS